MQLSKQPSVYPPFCGTRAHLCIFMGGEPCIRKSIPALSGIQNACFEKKCSIMRFALIDLDRNA